MRVDGIHLVREWIDLRHRNSKMRIVLERQADTVRFSGESEVRGIAVIMFLTAIVPCLD
jgi:hypothetical protein